MGGSFNPVHIAHLALADYLCQTAGLDEIWLMMSPENPLKQSVEKASESDRMAMLEIACNGMVRLKPSGFELSLPRPSYTFNTLVKLSENYPDCKFTLIIGSDNMAIFDRWRSHDEIIDRFGVIVYPRPGYPVDKAVLRPGVRVVDAPMLDISSTMIRDAIGRGIDMNLFLPQGVYQYIVRNQLYTRHE